MGRGPVIAIRKMKSDALKQKIFTMHSKLIAIAASKGGDPDKNPLLAEAIRRARKDNVPNENIIKAIKKGTGEDKSGTQIDLVIYEGYGPGGVAVIVTTLTDNKNRTASNVRHIFSKYGGNLGEPGSVSFVFERKGVLVVDLKDFKKEELEDLVFQTNAEDFFEEEGMFKIITSLHDFASVKRFFEDRGVDFEFADIDFIPINTVEINDFDKALKLTKMLEAFGEDEDVERVSINGNIPQELQKEVDEFIKKNTFKS